MIATTYSSIDNGKLFNPGLDNDEIDIHELSHNESWMYLTKLTYLRKVELKVAQARKEGLIGGPVHLAIGQEAIPAGISYFIDNADAVFGAHRSHGHILSLGCDLKRFFSELLGRSDGLSKGIGGSMHLWDESVGFYGSVPIVGGTISLAVGAGLSFKLLNKPSIAVAYLGDGAAEEGVFHESLNFAKMNRSRVLFVVENNLFASHMHISQRQPTNLVSRHAEANHISYCCVDGNNIVKLHEASKLAVNHIRENDEPFLIEAVTFRHFGHVDWREDIDVGVNRSQVDLDNWKKKDPITRLVSAMLKSKSLTEDEHIKLINSIQLKIDSAFESALLGTYSTKDDEFLWSRKI